MTLIPAIADIVHYVSHGTPPRPDGTQAFASRCRAAIVTAVGPGGLHDDSLSLAVINPTGLFFHESCEHDDGAETPGSPDCPNAASHGNPFRYCACGWVEAAQRGGTWHWPESTGEPFVRRAGFALDDSKPDLAPEVRNV